MTRAQAWAIMGALQVLEDKDVRFNVPKTCELPYSEVGDGAVELVKTIRLLYPDIFNSYPDLAEVKEVRMLCDGSVEIKGSLGS